MKNQLIYLDHNATSPVSEEHLKELTQALLCSVGNPSSPHGLGRNASVALTQARQSVAKALGVDVGEVVFTSGATESNQMATWGVIQWFRSVQPRGLCHVVASAIEHPSILEPLQSMASRGELELTLVLPNAQGVVSAQEFLSCIRPSTQLLCLMAVNNEIGTIQPTEEISKALHEGRWGGGPDPLLFPEGIGKEHLRRLHFHVDGVQALGKLPVSHWLGLGVDSCAVSGHKLGALQGVGALFLRRGRHFEPLLKGGAQEKNRRAGTENLPGILSFGLVCQQLCKSAYWEEKVPRMVALRDLLIEKISNFKGVQIISRSDALGAPHVVHFVVDAQKTCSGINGEDVLLELDLNGVCASSGSACSSGVHLVSKVLLALGLNAVLSKNAVRLSLGLNTEEKDVERVYDVLQGIFLA